MCGIFGLSAKPNSNLSSGSLKSTLDCLFKLSESRGKESSGMAFFSGRKIQVYKQPLTASLLIKRKEYQDLLNDSLRADSQPLTFIGHTRLVTDGNLEFNYNNQPVIKDGLVAVHNGIITNYDALWGQFPSLKKEYQIDTEIGLSLIRRFLNQGASLRESVKRTFDLIEGAASMAILFNDINCLLLASNTGSLYFCQSQNEDIFIFASELHILRSLIKKQRLQKLLAGGRIKQIKHHSGCLINLAHLKTEEFSFNQQESSSFQPAADFEIIDLSPQDKKEPLPDIDLTKSSFSMVDKAVYPDINFLRRCAKCILPETMPFIEFDDKGICNYCRDYKKMEIKGKAALEQAVAPYRNKSGRPDCLLAFSGGRDSSYGLHYIKNVLKMNPLVYSYDWGMITDLARRNQARICGKSGIEHILISADIKKKRENIRKNVLAWLKKPDLGMIPLFMAGDKQYFYYANKLRKQQNIKLIIYCENPLERTNFKNGFCGIRPSNVNKHILALSLINRINLFAYYSKQVLFNPGYLNSSLFDTLGAYLSSYFIPHNYLFLYQYIKWDEDEIISTLRKEYNWELADDTKATWRIGDGTAAFYNYIYYTMAGFTENDTFKSNQIREGMISREEALRLVERENQPRYQSIKWYCDTIGIDFKMALAKIGSVRRLYPML